MLARSVLKRLSSEERSYVREGGLLLGIITGGISYMNYRMYIQKEFLRSEAHYRFETKMANMTPWK